MSTRSLTHVHDDDGQTILTLYKQHDGYPSGWGKDLAKFLTGFHIVNGLRCGLDAPKKIANGMGCLAAQLVAAVKDEPGQFYIYRADASDCGEEYVYHVYRGEKTVINPAAKFHEEAHFLRLTCAEAKGKAIFSAAPDGFAAFVDKPEPAG